eukprot:3030245-Amphidinium_carterae.1
MACMDYINTTAVSYFCPRRLSRTINNQHGTGKSPQNNGLNGHILSFFFGGKLPMNYLQKLETAEELLSVDCTNRAMQGK